MIPVFRSQANVRHLLQSAKCSFSFFNPVTVRISCQVISNVCQQQVESNSISTNQRPHFLVVNCCSDVHSADSKNGTFLDYVTTYPVCSYSINIVILKKSSNLLIFLVPVYLITKFEFIGFFHRYTKLA